MSVLSFECHFLSVERLHGLLDILPSDEEEKKLIQAASYTHDLIKHAPVTMPDDVTPYPPTPPISLHEVELFMLATMKVPRMGPKVRCFHFKQAFQESLQTLRGSFGRHFGGRGEVKPIGTRTGSLTLPW